MALATLAWIGTADAQGTKRHRPEPEPDTGAPAGHRIEVVNHETARIISVYVSASRDHEWGDDLLGNDELDTQATAVVTFKGVCRVDIRIDFEGGASESRRFVDVCRFPSLVIEPGWTLRPMTAA